MPARLGVVLTKWPVSYVGFLESPPVRGGMERGGNLHPLGRRIGQSRAVCVVPWQMRQSCMYLHVREEHSPRFHRKHDSVAEGARFSGGGAGNCSLSGAAGVGPMDEEWPVREANQMSGWR